MKFHHRWVVTAFFAIVLSVSSVANAALVSRLGGQAVYDPDLDITWLADANYAQTSGYDADGLMTWSEAMTWAGNLSYGGYSDWRLPNTLVPDSNCVFPSGAVSTGYNCTGSEMGHLFYNELGGVAFSDIATTHNANYSLFNNVKSNFYWSGTEYAPNTSLVYGFFFAQGFQEIDSKTNPADVYAWAVRDGNVAAVPVPGALWLFGSGLMGLAAIARRGKT